ncbi:hypothetical protein L9F63_014863, partial [Diploptera punctata]
CCRYGHRGRISPFTPLRFVFITSCHSQNHHSCSLLDRICFDIISLRISTSSIGKDRHKTKLHAAQVLLHDSHCSSQILIS